MSDSTQAPPASAPGGTGSTLRNVVLVSFATYLEAASGLLVGVLIARALGPHDFGHYAFAVWLCGWLILASNNGLTTSSIKFVAEARGAGRPEVAAALALRLRRLQITSSSIVLCTFVVIVLSWPPDDWHDTYAMYLPLAVVAVWARAGFWALGSIAKGYERFEPENLALALTALLNFGLVLGVWMIDGTAEQYFAVYAASGLISNFIVRRSMRNYGIVAQAGPIPDEIRRRFNRHLILTALVIGLTLLSNRSVEMLLLRAFAEPAVVGYFAIAGTLTKGAVDLLAGGLAAVLLPAMSRAFGSGGRTSLADMLSESARLYWIIGLAIAGGGVTVAEGAIHLLYDHRYQDAVPAVMWNLVLAGLLVTNGATAATLIAGDRQGDRIRISMIAMVVNVVAGIALIPSYGLMGAIASLAITKFTEFALAWWYVQRRVRTRLAYKPMMRSAAAAILGTAVGLAISDQVHLKLAFVAGGGAFVLVYLGSLVVFRALRRGDYETLAVLLDRRGKNMKRRAAWLRRLGDRFAYPN